MLYMLNINMQSICIMQNKKYIFNYEKNISIQVFKYFIVVDIFYENLCICINIRILIMYFYNKNASFFGFKY